MAIFPSSITIREEPWSELRGHVEVSKNCFVAHTVFDVLTQSGGHQLRERRRDRPFRKDYDLVEDPMEWSKRFDVSNWALIGAFDGNVRVGGAIGAIRTPAIEMLEGRTDLIVLWDLRVSPDARRRGVGSALFCAIEAFGRKRNCRELKVETQNTNVGSCKFYALQGCQLKQANPAAYPGLPDEVQLLWSKALDG